MRNFVPCESIKKACELNIDGMFTGKEILRVHKGKSKRKRSGFPDLLQISVGMLHVKLLGKCVAPMQYGLRPLLMVFSPLLLVTGESLPFIFCPKRRN